eukprot:1548523-Pleurochrysis_carterae.AAC.1
MPTYNKLIAARTIDRDGVSTPSRPITRAEMQGKKAMYGMCQCSHSVWCFCRKGAEQQHAYAPRTITTYNDMLNYCHKVGCEMKTFDDMCALAHFSPGVARGGAFTPFSCPVYDYAPEEED